MQRKIDNGESTFDKFRSPESTPIAPEGEILQRMCMSETYNEQERRRMAETAVYWPEGIGKELFNVQMNSPGASTFSKGRVFDCPEPETSEMRKKVDSPSVLRG